MKPILLSCVLAFCSLVSQCQTSSTRGEFADQPNGLMYSEADLKILRYLVDSLNLRFKNCDLTQTYYSVPQARVYNVSFSSSTNDLLEIKKSIDAKMGFAELTQKFAAYISKIDTTELFMAYTDTSANGRLCLEGSPGEGYNRVHRFKLDPASVYQQWSYEYYKKGDYGKEYSLYCRYFPYPLKRKPIPNVYARWIQYVDCMIDTNATVMLAKGWSDRFDTVRHEKMIKMANYINKRMGHPPVQESINNWELFNEDQVSFAIKELKQDANFISVLSELVDDCVKNGYGNETLESLVENCLSKEKALFMKRSRIVVGYCSQDLSPRIHAREIAMLAAETHSWDIFLRAHLDIMNDRFQRNIDASYAWQSRKTYLKELEELNLNVVDLMMGLTLRADNVAPNHYHGTIWRTGWALTESKEKDRFEELAFQAMKDDKLDEFNRGLFFLLYHSYLMRLENDKEIAQKIGAIKSKANEFPLFIRDQILQLKPPDRRDRE